MSTTTKSPKRVAKAALTAATAVLPLYAHPFSPKKFTQPQLFVCLVLKIFLKQDYRGIVALLDDWPELRKSIGLKTIPHYTTIQKASIRLLQSENIRHLLEKTTQMLKGSIPDVPLAALESTGLQSGHISPHYYNICSKAFKNRKWTRFTRWPKIAVIVDVATHLILAVYPTRGPGRDCTHFADILQNIPDSVCVDRLVADAGYDSEAAHRIAVERFDITTIIPPKIGRRARGLPKTPYRRAMKTDFDTVSYGQRWQAETVSENSVTPSTARRSRARIKKWLCWL